MNEDMKRLCEAASVAIAAAHHGVGLTTHDREIVVRAVLTELKTNISEAALYAIHDALRNCPRPSKVEGQEELQASLLGTVALIEHILQGD